MKRVKLLICIVNLILITQPLFAQALPDTTLENALFWKITGKGLKDPSYLYGTMHVFCKQDIVLPEIVKEKILASNKFFLEISIEKKDTFKNSVITKKRFAHSYKIKDIIGDANFYKAKKIIDEYKPIAEDTLEKLNFMAFNQFLTSSFLGCEISSFDYMLAAYAIDNGKKIDELDVRSYKELQEDNFFDNRVREMIKSNWDNMDYNLWRLKKMIVLYKERRVTDLYLLSAYKNNGKETSLKTGMLDNRNENWVLTINKAIKKNPCFFAFGSAHLAGSKGVISLLRKKGYTVTPIFY